MRRWPQLRVLPQAYIGSSEWGAGNVRFRHPAQHFMDKYRKLMRKGYNGIKAFDMVEEELTDLFEKQRDEIRILRGAALTGYGESYLDHAQRIAELESEMRLDRFVRDIPKYERQQEWLN
jgi:hypothetical protein